MVDAKSIFDGLTGKPLMQAIKRNHGVLRKCSCHKFPVENANWRLNYRVKCQRCGGEMSLDHARVWTKGFEAGLKKGREKNQ